MEKYFEGWAMHAWRVWKEKNRGMKNENSARAVRAFDGTRLGFIPGGFPGGLQEAEVERDAIERMLNARSTEWWFPFNKAGLSVERKGKERKRKRKRNSKSNEKARERGNQPS